MPTVAVPLLRVASATKRFGSVAAVRDVDLEVFSGDFLVIFGPNGAGKTTLLRMIASLTEPTSGEIQFSIGGGNQNGSRVGYVSHQSLLYNELSGFENLLFYARLYALKNMRTKVGEMVAKMGLQDSQNRLVREYSRGMKQRLTLARALLHEPQMLLLDEPYTGLDQHGGRVLTDVLRKLREEGRTIMLITHNLAEGLELCTRVVIQHRGQIVFHAAAPELDKSDFERLYLQAVES